MSFYGARYREELVSHYKRFWLIPCFLLLLRGSSCADPNSCMRHSDCKSDARCVDGVCRALPKNTAGTAGVTATANATMSNGGSSSGEGGAGGTSDTSNVSAPNGGSTDTGTGGGSGDTAST
jgi:hypothetical protein